MSVPLQIQCPRCKSRLKLKNRESVGKKFRCRSCREVFKADEPLESDALGEFDSNSEPEEWKPSPPISKRPPKSRTRPKLPLSASQRYVAAGVAGAALMCVLIFVPWGKVSRAVSNLIPFSNSAGSIASRLESLSRKYDKLLDSIENGKPGSNVKPAAKNLLDDVQDLYLRAARLRPHSQDEVKALFEQHPKLKDPSGGGLFRARRDLRDRIMNFAHNDIETDVLLMQTGFHGYKILQIVQHLDAPPEPVDEGDKTEAEMIDVLHDAIDDMTGYDSEGDLKSGAADVSAHAQRLKTLAGRLEEQRASGQAKNQDSTAHEQYRKLLEARIADVFLILTARCGTNPEFVAAVQKLRVADSLLVGRGEKKRHIPRSVLFPHGSFGDEEDSGDSVHRRNSPRPPRRNVPWEVKGTFGANATEGTERPADRTIPIEPVDDNAASVAEPPAKESPEAPDDEKPAPADESPFKPEDEESPFKPE